MNATQRRGLRRVAIVVLVPWALAWSAVYVTNEQAARAFEAEVSRTQLCLWGDCGPYVITEEGVSPEQIKRNQRAYMGKQEELKAAAQRWMKRSLWLGIGGIVLATCGFVAGLWVLRGFQKPPISN